MSFLDGLFTGDTTAEALLFSETVLDADATIEAGSVYRVGVGGGAIELTLGDTTTHGARLGIKLTQGDGSPAVTITMTGSNLIEHQSNLGMFDTFTIDSRFGAYYEWMFDADVGAWWLVTVVAGKSGG